LTGVVSNAQLAYSSVTVTAGTGFGGGGAVALGGSITLSNTGVLSITGDADITTSTNVGAVILGTTATSANTTNTIVKRDGSGDFSAGTITLAGALNLVNALDNTAVGSSALSNNIAGSNNTANGWAALYSNTNGYANTATGWEALYSNLGGYENTANGALALFSSTTGYQKHGQRRLRALLQHGPAPTTPPMVGRRFSPTIAAATTSPTARSPFTTT